MSLYTDIVSAGIPMSSHYSDLYCKATPEALDLIKKHGLRASVFKNQVNGEVWLDVPFQFDPYWEKKK